MIQMLVVTDSAQHGEPFVFYIPPPIVIRLVIIAMFAFPVIIFLGIGLVEYPEKFFSHVNQLFSVVILLGSFQGIGIWLLAFPPKGALARLEFRHDKVTVVPRSISQTPWRASGRGACYTSIERNHPVP